MTALAVLPPALPRDPPVDRAAIDRRVTELAYPDAVAYLRRRRRILELSQDSVAAMVGVSRPTFTWWEVGRTAPSAPQFFAWARALDRAVTLGDGG